MYYNRKNLGGLIALSFGLIILFTTVLPGQTPTNSALYFDGVDDEVLFPCHLSDNPQYTVECWFKPESPGTGTMQALISSISLGQFIHLQIATSGNIVAYQNIGWSTFPIVQPTPYDTWRHIAISLKPGLQQLYVNGALIATRFDPYSVTMRTKNLRIGSGYASGRYFRGFIDEVRIWTVARTQQQIQSTMNTEVPGDTAGLLVYYRMDSLTSAGLVEDATPNEFHGYRRGCNGAQNFPQFVNANNPSFLTLPVTLLSFYGQQEGNIIRLYWSTASEVNNDYFSIEKQVDGQWQEVGVRDGRGTTSDISNYVFTDESPGRGTNYYRLVQTDFNGQQDISDIEVVRFESYAETEASLNLYPNPTDGMLTVEVNGLEGSDWDQKGSIAIVMQTAHDIMPYEIQGKSTKIDVSKYPSGIYIVQVVLSTGDVLTGRFVKD